MQSIQTKVAHSAAPSKRTKTPHVFQSTRLELFHSDFFGEWVFFSVKFVDIYWNPSPLFATRRFCPPPQGQNFWKELANHSSYLWPPFVHRLRHHFVRLPNDCCFRYRLHPFVSLSQSEGFTLVPKVNTLKSTCIISLFPIPVMNLFKPSSPAAFALYYIPSNFATSDSCCIHSTPWTISPSFCIIYTHLPACCRFEARPTPWHL